MFLHNRVNHEELRKRIQNDNTPRTTLSFYRYVILENPAQMRDELYRAWAELGVLGRIYIAREGINAQLSVPTANFENFRKHVDSVPEYVQVPFKIAVEDDGKSFFLLSIKVRKKIVADGLDDDAYDVTNVGKHLSAEEFNEAMDDPETIVVDMRNHYEAEVGRFEGALTPDVDTFREELPWVVENLQDKKDKKVLMYCTGGIRCEKASAYLRHHGFEDVNQLHGGIISYAQEIKQKGIPSKFKGKNFVFDERLGERITDDIISECHQCGEKCDTHTNCENVDCNLLFIQCENCGNVFEGCCSKECNDIIHLSDEKQKELRKGKTHPYTNMIFRKGRLRPNGKQLQNFTLSR
ncbi:MAG: rhodanese-related sulfurtransferase [Bacteroidia bacterium]